MKYFRLLYRLAHEQCYLIWISNEKDHVILGDAGIIPIFRDVEAANAYAHRNGYKLESEEPVLHDLDWVVAWVGEPTMPINCNEALVRMPTLPIVPTFGKTRSPG